MLKESEKEQFIPPQTFVHGWTVGKQFVLLGTNRFLDSTHPENPKIQKSMWVTRIQEDPSLWAGLLATRPETYIQRQGGCPGQNKSISLFWAWLGWTVCNNPGPQQWAAQQWQEQDLCMFTWRQDDIPFDCSAALFPGAKPNFLCFDTSEISTTAFCRAEQKLQRHKLNVSYQRYKCKNGF